MNLFPSLVEKYTKETLSAREAQRLAEFIAWGPVVFQASRIMLKWGVFDLLRDSDGGLTRQEICERTGYSDYAIKCLLEASLCIGTVLVDVNTNKYSLSKTGWFLINDPAIRVNIDFNHDVNYEGFPEALKIVFDKYQVKSLYDVGGNTGKWALHCVSYNPEVEVVILDLPQQIEMMQDNVSDKTGAERIKGYGINLLDSNAVFPQREGGLDAIWMSQFLDCFSMDEIICILKRAKDAMTERTRLFIMETLWDRQRFEPAAFCLTMTSLYFSAIANGNSKMYNTEDMEYCINSAGLEIEQIHDHLGQGHSIIVCKIVNK